MAKNTFLDWDTTASNNTDIGGVGILGVNAVNNFDDALRTMMAQLASGLDGKAVLATKTGNYTAVAADNNAVHRYTAAATVTLTAAATLAANWHYTVIANGADVVIDPNGSETIDGRTTLTVRDGSWVLVVCDGTNFKTNLMADQRADRGAINGLTLANNAVDATNDIDISTGECASDGTIPYLIVLGAALSKRLDATWAVGTGNGGLDTGSIANTTYHVWLIQRSDTGVVDALFSLSPTAPTMPSGYDRKRRIGAILREAGAIVKFLQYGDLFLRAKITDVTVASFYAVTGTTLSVPALIQVQPIMGLQVTSGAASDVTIAIGSGTDLSTEIIGVLRALSSSSVSGWVSSGVMTNTSRQIYTAVIGSGTVVGALVVTKGWIDTRGRI